VTPCSAFETILFFLQDPRRAAELVAASDATSHVHSARAMYFSACRSAPVSLGPLG